MKKSTEEDFYEIAAFINKRLEGFNFVLVSTSPNERNNFKYTSNLSREEGIEVLFNTAVELELKNCHKLAKLEIIRKIKR